MIHVIATLHVKEGYLPEFLKHFKANVPNVLAEDGCIEYIPTIDTETGLEAQQIDGNAAVIVEKWRDLPALKAHLEAPHMLAFREQVKDLLESASLKILENA
ncbi:MAG TPA: antibiotic biosynthesis monooxygenase [Opitutae bacterium]|nr:antibiotic biosynthesis monooxygenase [Opitutaceae bacterium]HCR30069.1 antibiotic biosynthesis monooxygenase [Opitutae bacterium]